MFEEFLSDLGKAFTAGLLTGGAFVAMRGRHLGQFTNICARPGGGTNEIARSLNGGSRRSLPWMLSAIRV
jgi:hypothetical protein